MVHGLDPKVLRAEYTPVTGCVGDEHTRTPFQESSKIPGPPFDLKCIGKPLLWNNSDSYTIQKVWSKATANAFTVSKASPKIPSELEAVKHVEQMLRWRPLSTDMDRWAK